MAVALLVRVAANSSVDGEGVVCRMERCGDRLCADAGRARDKLGVVAEAVLGRAADGLRNSLVARTRFVLLVAGRKDVAFSLGFGVAAVLLCA